VVLQRGPRQHRRAILATIMFKRAATQTIRAAAASTRAAEATRAAQKALLQAIDAQGDAYGEAGCRDCQGRRY